MERRPSSHSFVNACGGTDAPGFATTAPPGMVADRILTAGERSGVYLDSMDRDEAEIYPDQTLLNQSRSMNAKNQPSMASFRAPEVTVVVTTRNRRAWLEQCIGSVLCQKYLEPKIIVVDDASDDDTWNWLRDLPDGLLTAIRHDIRQERASARNRGLAAVSTPYVMFLDDDDQLWPDALCLLTQRLELQDSSVAAVGARQAWFVAERYRRREPHPRRTLARDCQLDVIFGWCVTGGQVVLRTDIARAIGGFNSQFIPCEDRDFWFRLAQTGRFILIPETVLTYRQHPGQIVDQGRQELRNRVASNSISALPKIQQMRALRLRQAKEWFDRAEHSVMKGKSLRGIIELLRGFGASSDVLRSPLLNEWVIRWILGRALRYYIPAAEVEREGTSAAVWQCPPGALAFHSDAPVIPAGVKAHPILVQFSGGIGNQLFQYAAALVISSQTGSAIYFIPTDSPLRSGEVDLEDLLGSLPSPDKITLLRFGLPPFLSKPKFRRRWRRLMNVIGLRKLVWRGHGQYRETIEHPLIGTGLLLAGYFQSLEWVESSFENITKSIHKKMPSTVQSQPDVIAISMRTGRDFKINRWLLPINYYCMALERHGCKQTQRVWVIGDCDRDTSIFAHRLRTEGWNVETPPSHEGIKILDDFWNLTTAGSIILSNSTFAWWAAIVGDYFYAPKPRKVVFPDPWLPKPTSNLARNTWIKLNYGSSEETINTQPQ